MAIPPVPAPTDESIAAAIEARDRERAAFTAATNVALDGDGRIVMTTPTLYPPWFPSYHAFRMHINALVATKEAEIRAKDEGAK